MSKQENNDKRTLTRVTTPPKLKKYSEKHKNPSYFSENPDNPTTTSNRMTTELTQNSQNPQFSQIMSSTDAQQEQVVNMSDQQYLNLISSSSSSAFVPAGQFYQSQRNPLSATTHRNIPIKRETIKIEDHRSKRVVSPKSIAKYPEPLQKDKELEERQNSRQNLIFIESNVYFVELIDNAENPDAIRKLQSGSSPTYNASLGRRCFINKKQIALFKYKKKVYAFDDTCCHQGANISNGMIEDIEEVVGGVERKRACVVCPRHHWKFDIITGECTSNAEEVQPVYPCIVSESGEVKVGFKEIDKSVFESPDF